MRWLLVYALIGCGQDAVMMTTTTMGVCGDGVVDPGEQCDDGNLIDGDGCSPLCKSQHVAVCGNGMVEPAGEECDDGNTIDGDGCSATCRYEPRPIHASWGFRNVATNTTTGCPDGFDTVAISSKPIHLDGPVNGIAQTDMVDCAAQTVTYTLFPGLYDVTLAITNHDGTQTFATSLPIEVDAISVPTRPFFVEILNDGGYFMVIGDAACIPPNAVWMRVTSSTSTATTVDFIPCNSGMTRGLVAGTYTVQVEGDDGQYQPVSLPITQTNQVLFDRNAITYLDPFTQ